MYAIAAYPDASLIDDWGQGVNDFGSYLKAQRKARGWTLKEAADRIGTSTSRLAEVERGKSYHTDHATRPSRELVERMAYAYGLPVDILLIEAGYSPSPARDLSQEDNRMLLLFQALPPDRKELALGILRLMAEGSTTG